MRVLGIEGALGAFSAALVDGGNVIAGRALEGNVALEGGLDIVASLFSAAGWRRDDVDRIAVGIGPGGFTGLRIAIAYAKALAQAWNVPLVPVSSFEILKYGARGGADLLTVVVGRPGIISAEYAGHGGALRTSGPVAEVLIALLPADLPRLMAIGAPEDVLAGCAERGIIVDCPPTAITPAAAVAALIAESAQPAATPHEVRADYGELPAAKVPVFPKVRNAR